MIPVHGKLGKGPLLAALETGAAEDRAARVAAAKAPPEAWRPIASAPKDGTLLDLLFDPATAEAGMAEFYAPGCTRKKAPAEPIIENVVYLNGGFKPVVDAEAARLAAALKGGWGAVPGLLHGVVSVEPTHWRPAAYPPVE